MILEPGGVEPRSEAVLVEHKSAELLSTEVCRSQNERVLLDILSASSWGRASIASWEASLGTQLRLTCLSSMERDEGAGERREFRRMGEEGKLRWIDRKREERREGLRELSRCGIGRGPKVYSGVMGTRAGVEGC